MTERATDKDRKPNRLLKAASPYLRQHAYNPIDWHEWGEEAFARAEKENKPIFLSVGYSTCHWCHVMERESFEDEGIAGLLNGSFVPVKLDRERQPDVDETYMLATQLVTGQGGWPNSVFLTPDRKPFYAGTYFPPDTFRGLLMQVAGYWQEKEQALRADADKLAETIDSVMTRRVEAAEVTPETLTEAAGLLLRSFDPVHGGFGGAPKFPQEALLLFLLRMAEKDGHAGALDAAAKSLLAMLDGGIHDHAGGGFHRYAVDREWLVPHFEKMLYNQALITQALLRAYRLTGNGRFASGARACLDYVLADMTDPEGGFYSARDADSEGEEGTFYVWTPEQVDTALGEDDGAFARAAFGVTAQGNFENGTTVLHYPRPPRELAKELGVDEDEFHARIGKICEKLAGARASREPPIRDEKIIAAWNGMMIAAFAEAAEVLGEARYADAAARAATFLWEKLRVDGKPARAYFEGEAALEAQQEDHAFGALGFIALYDLTGERLWLERAEAFIAEMTERFRDAGAGDYFMTAEASAFSRAKSRTDAGTPSGNAAALEAFAKLARRTANPDHRLNGEALLAALSGIAVKSPPSSAYALMAADMLLRGDAGPRQFLAQGAVEARAALDRETGTLTVSLRIADGWHVNSNAPLEETFVPTQVTVEGMEDAEAVYPAHETRTPGFHGGEVAVFEDEVEIAVKLPRLPEEAVIAQLRLQACSDQLCLEPETAGFRLSATAASVTG